MSESLFSVIMPLHNHAPYVESAIRSVQGQRHGGWELIVVDDGSTDDGGAIADRLAADDPRIRVIHQRNAGSAAARNAAIAVAKGPWLAFLDSDDLWLPQALECYADYIRRNPDAQFVYGFRHRLRGDTVDTELNGELQDHPTGTAEIFGRMYLTMLAVCYRRDLVHRVGGFDESLRCCEDYELYLRLSLHCRFEPLGQAVGLRRQHETNISQRSGYTRMVEAEVLRRFVDRQGGSAVLAPASVRRRLGQLYCSAALEYFRAGNFREARCAARMARRFKPSVRSQVLAALSLLLSPMARRDVRPVPQL